jgi:hypothetical protein
MGLSLAELDAQSVTLLPERATLHSGANIVIVKVIKPKAFVIDNSWGSYDTNTAANVFIVFNG